MGDISAAAAVILRPDEGPAGTGFVASKDGLIATCAHVVAAAGAVPGEIVPIVYFADNRRAKAQVEASCWRDEHDQDVAILCLEASVPDAVVVPGLSLAAYLKKGSLLDTFGFPKIPQLDGVAGRCEFLGWTRRRGFPVLEFSSGQVTAGFSGAPLAERFSQRVCGMVSEILSLDQYQRLGSMFLAIPLETMLAVCPGLHLAALKPGLIRQVLAIHSLFVLRTLTKLMTGPVARVLCGQALKSDKRHMLTLASKMPRSRYLDTGYLEGITSELQRQTHDMHTLLAALGIVKDSVPRQALFVAVQRRAAHLVGELSRIYRFSKGQRQDFTRRLLGAGTSSS